MSELLSVQNLSIEFKTERGSVRAVDGVSFSLAEGETVGIVGESGCGKTVTALSILRLIPMPPGRFAGGDLTFQGKSLRAMTEREIRQVRGNDVAMIFQEPMTALDPVFTVGSQMQEVLRRHRKLSRKDARAMAIELLKKVRIPSPETRIDNYPHELSGGMRQRVMIAMAISCEPKLLIADEPTTALDVTTQAQVLEQIRLLQSERNMSLILVSHDIGVIAEACRRVIVMYCGRIIESGPIEVVLRAPRHPYTKGLFQSIPKIRKQRLAVLPTIDGMVPDLSKLPTGCAFADCCPNRQPRCVEQRPPLEPHGDRAYACFYPEGGELVSALVEIRGLKKYFKNLRAVDDVTLELPAGKTLGLVGESGCGKSTLARAVLRLIEPTAGQIFFDGTDITALSRRDLVPHRRNFQMIFQDPYASLNPRMTIFDTLLEPLQVHGVGTDKVRHQRVEELIELVGMNRAVLDRYPHEFSGGQRQRVGIARALTLSPKFIVADEPVSALDVSVQSQVLNLMTEIQRRFGLAMLFISHDLAVVQHVSHEVAVMYLGKIVERASVDALYSGPKHPYTQALLAAVPSREPGQKRERIVLGGDVPSAAKPPSGCAFHPRCPLAEDRCRVEIPKLVNLGSTDSPHWVSCHLAR